MKKLRYYLSLITLLISSCLSAQTSTPVNRFNKVIVSPHIQVTFVEGNEESVTIENATVNPEKINIVVKNKTLRIYLDDAKELTKNKTIHEPGHKIKQPIYKGTVVTARVTYKNLHKLSVRGEEQQVCESVLHGRKFTLRIYGESKVIVNKAELGELRAALYGESYLTIRSGSINSQKYTAYGESKVNSLGTNGITGKITAFGEADFRMNVSDEIKLIAFGEAKLQYQGDARINKAMHIGKLQVSKID